MNIDWKEALGALKDSGEIPVDDTPDPTPSPSSSDTGKPVLHVVTDRKGRKGKTATIIEGITLPGDEVENLAKILKQRLGTGGSVRGQEILIQGDRKSDVCRMLADLGYKTK